jgi:hypothetical protein
VYARREQAISAILRFKQDYDKQREEASAASASFATAAGGGAVGMTAGVAAGSARATTAGATGGQTAAAAAAAMSGTNSVAKASAAGATDDEDALVKSVCSMPLDSVHRVTDCLKAVNEAINTAVGRREPKVQHLQKLAAKLASALREVRRFFIYCMPFLFVCT